MLNVSQSSISFTVFNVSKQFVRYRQFNTVKPRKPHFWAKKINIIKEPIYAKDYDLHFPMHLKCRKTYESLLIQEKEEENPYERILANEIKDELSRARMVLFFHLNPTNNHFFYKSLKSFKKEGMTLMRNSKTTVKMAVENTKYESILSLFHSHTSFLCSPEVKLDIAYKVLKNYPFFILLAGIVEDRFLSRSKLDEYSKIPDLNCARSQICATLNSSVSHLLQNITAPPILTVSYLNEYVKMQTQKERSIADDKSNPS